MKGPRRTLVAGFAFFLAAKLIWVMAPLPLMGMPRLGDDALVYLWTGANNFLTQQSTSRALEDISALQRLEDGATAHRVFFRDRVSMRVIGSEPSPWYAALNVLLNAGLSSKAAFAVQEVAVAVILAVAVAAFLTRLFGPAEAGLGLMVLAFLFLPGQGMHYMVPGLLAFALGLLVWREALAHRPRSVLVFVLALLALLVHPVGLIYIVIAVVLRLCRWPRRPPILGEVGFLGAILFAGVLCFLGRLLPGVVPEIAGGLGSIRVSAMQENLGGFATDLVYWIRRQPVMYGAVAAGFVIAVAGHRVGRDAILVFGLLLCALFASLVFALPGYPGELALRILVPVAVMASGAAGAVLARAQEKATRCGYMASFPIVACVVALGAPEMMQRMIDNVNFRWQIFDERGISSALDRLPKDATIIYGDTDIGMMSAFLAGATRFGALPWPMVAESPRTANIMPSAAMPTVLALVPPKSLNGLAAINSQSWNARFYGYSFDAFRRVIISHKGGFQGPIHVRLEPPQIEGLRATAEIENRSGVCKVPIEAVPRSGAAGWFALDPSACGAVVRIRLSDAGGKLAITGLGLAPFQEGRDWPWGEDGLVLRAEARDADAVAEVAFSWRALLAANGADGLASHIAEPPRLIGDSGGLILARVRTQAER